MTGKIKCLQLCNDLLGSEVHQHLYRHLAEADLCQDIFYPLRRHKLALAAKIEDRNLPPVIVSRMLRKYHRVLFTNKIKWLYEDLRSKTDVSSYTIAHATTLFSDGALALRLNREFGIPYIVAVRASDFAFLRYRRNLHSLGTQIIQNASQVLFVSEALKEKLHRHKIHRRAGESARQKSVTIPNGVSPFWLSKIEPPRQRSPERIIYVGNFFKRKNILKLVKAVLMLKHEFPNLHLDLVGVGGVEEKPVLQLTRENPDCLTYHGPVYDQSKLREHYLQNDCFAMPSVKETFGLVYIEALTQGLPILFTKGDGIDGLIDKNIGCAVDPATPENIADGLRDMLQHYQDFEIDEVDFNDFSWQEISRKYLSLYETFSK